MTAAAPPLPALEAYRLWAANYGEENPVTALEDCCVRELTPSLRGKWLLDAACGTGRRLPRMGGGGARRVAGIDLVYEMLQRARPRANGDAAVSTPPDPHDGRARSAARLGSSRFRAQLAVADLRAIPFPHRSFHLIWCRLAVGHLPELAGVYQELARVARSDAHVIVTDFHPRAPIAGHVRSFRDARGRKRVVQHFIHDVAEHVAAAERVGLRLVECREPIVGRAVRSFYASAGKLDAYERQRGLPLVLALAFHS